MEKNKRIYIIGAGATASIVKLFCPEAKMIAPAGRSFLPIHYVWDTKYTRKFMKQFKIPFHFKNVEIFKGTKPEEIELYNEITHKPKNNKPSEGKKQIESLICMLPEFQNDINETVIELTDKEIITENNRYKYDQVFICSPLLFKSKYGIKTYYPMRIYKGQILNGKKVKWDYAYLGGRLLKNSIYRASMEKSDLFLEQTGDVTQSFTDIEWMFKEFFGLDIKIQASFVNKFAHFDRPKKVNADTKKVIFASRLSSLDNEFLFSTLIEKMYKLKR